MDWTIRVAWSLIVVGVFTFWAFAMYLVFGGGIE